MCKNKDQSNAQIPIEPMWRVGVEDIYGEVKVGPDAHSNKKETLNLDPMKQFEDENKGLVSSSSASSSVENLKDHNNPHEKHDKKPQVHNWVVVLVTHLSQI